MKKSGIVRFKKKQDVCLLKLNVAIWSIAVLFDLIYKYKLNRFWTESGNGNAKFLSLRKLLNNQPNQDQQLTT